MQDPEHKAALLIFLALVAITSMIVVTKTPAGSLTVSVEQPRSTVVITGIDLNDNIGDDVNSLTGEHLNALSSGTVHTQRSTTRYEQILRLKRTTTPTFDGGMLVYSKAESDDVSDFITWDNQQPLFEYELIFNPGLEGNLEDGHSEDMEGNALVVMGRPAFISRAEASGTRATVRLFTGGGEIEFEDSDITDNTFEDGVRVNGQHVQADVRIKGSITPRVFKIYSIQYRPLAEARDGGNIYVGPLHGLRGQLKNPGALLNPSFDIIYAGLSQGKRQLTTTSLPRVSGQQVRLLPSGSDEYKLQFTNNRGKTYTVPAYYLSGSVGLGEEGHDLVVVEGSSASDFNIDENDYFLVSSGTSTNSDSNILRLRRVDTDRIYVDDIAGGSFEEVFDTTTGQGTLTVGGRSYTFVADTSSSQIVVDQTGDGSFSGDRARIILQGGAQIVLFSSSIQVRVPTKLFKDDAPTSDEVTTISIIDDDGDISSTLSDVETEQAKDRVRRGMSDYGILFELADDRTPAPLTLTVPKGQVGANALVTSYPPTSGQARGWIVVTTERERFLRE